MDPPTPATTIQNRPVKVGRSTSSLHDERAGPGSALGDQVARRRGSPACPRGADRCEAAGAESNMCPLRKGELFALLETMCMIGVSRCDSPVVQAALAVRSCADLAGNQLGPAPQAQAPNTGRLAGVCAYCEDEAPRSAGACAPTVTSRLGAVPVAVLAGVVLPGRDGSRRPARGGRDYSKPRTLTIWLTSWLGGDDDAGHGG